MPEARFLVRGTLTYSIYPASFYKKVASYKPIRSRPDAQGKLAVRTVMRQEGGKGGGRTYFSLS